MRNSHVLTGDLVWALGASLDSFFFPRHSCDLQVSAEFLAADPFCTETTKKHGVIALLAIKRTAAASRLNGCRCRAAPGPEQLKKKIPSKRRQ